MGHRHDAAQWTAHLDRFDLRFPPPGEIDHFLQWRAHGDFIDPGPDEMAIQRDQFRSAALRRAYTGVGLAAHGEDGMEIGEGLHIVEDGRTPE